MDLLSDVGLLNILINIGHYYPKFVKEFIVNLSSSFKNAKSRDYRKVYVQGHYLSFPLTIINDFLGHEILVIVDRLTSMKIIIARAFHYYKIYISQRL